MNYIVRRTIQIIPIIFLIMAVNFFIIHAAPGDPALVFAGERTTLEEIERIRIQYGLNRPVHEQLALYFLRTLRGDLGTSTLYHKPVMMVIAERLPATLILFIPSIFLAFTLGSIIGAYMGKIYPSKTDSVLLLGSVMLYSVPTLWLGLMLILVFAVQLNWLPSYGMVSIGKTGVEYVLDLLRHLILPLITMVVWMLPQFIRVVRSKIITVMREEFIITVRAVGLDENTILFKHAFKNALIPALTLLSWYVGIALGGAVFTETVFAWPGLGRLMYLSIDTRDYSLLMGIFLFTSMCVILTSLITDIVLVYVDPRIKYR